MNDRQFPGLDNSGWNNDLLKPIGQAPPKRKNLVDLIQEVNIYYCYIFILKTRYILLYLCFFYTMKFISLFILIYILF